MSHIQIECGSCPSVSVLLLARFLHTLQCANVNGSASHDWQPTDGHVLLSAYDTSSQPKLTLRINYRLPHIHNVFPVVVARN